MEALLCRKDAEIGRMLAENFANLFEPELSQRHKAVEFMKRLYDQRSTVFHGSKTDLGPEEWRESQVTAAAILKALVERQAFVRRLKDHTDETPSRCSKVSRIIDTPKAPSPAFH